MIQWRIYYDDGSTYDSTMGSPADASGRGIIAIVEADEQCGRAVLNGWNWYYHDGNNWWGADVHGLLDRLCAHLPTQGVCQGRMASKQVFEDVLDKAITDPDFHPKSAICKRERPYQKVGWS